MSRESRLAKRDSKLKKLAAKHGVARLAPQTRTHADMVHAVRAAKYFQANNATEQAMHELQRAIKVVFPRGWLTHEHLPIEEQREKFEAKLLELAHEARINVGGKRDIPALALQLSEHLARIEHAKRMALR